jgi:hypothetical protein
MWHMEIGGRSSSPAALSLTRTTRRSAPRPSGVFCSSPFNFSRNPLSLGFRFVSTRLASGACVTRENTWCGTRGAALPTTVAARGGKLLQPDRWVTRVGREKLKQK